MALTFFHLAAGVSLLLCVAAVGAWGWGQWARLVVERWTAQSVYTLDVSRGEMHLMTFHLRDPLDRYPDFARGWHSSVQPEREFLTYVLLEIPNARAPVAGFFVGHTKRTTAEDTAILLPMWFVVSLFAILPLVAGVRLARRRRRARRLAAGCCVACGYDLRASPDRCPECGRVAGQPAAGSA